MGRVGGGGGGGGGGAKICWWHLSRMTKMAATIM